MLTAIILCRENSRRLKKHFYNIGKLTLIENLLKCISQNKSINEIFIATGQKKIITLLRKD